MRILHLLRSQWQRPYSFYRLLLYGILIIAFGVRVYNLNYNSPFKDEATSVYIGRFGLFQGDWQYYDPSSWMSGHPFINPLLSAAAYMTGGVVGSRLLNVILSVLTIEILAVIAVLLTNNKRAYLAGIITAVIATFSPIALYVSRMTTYDIKSFYCLSLAVLLLLWVERHEKNLGKWYFLAAIFLMGAVLSKIIALIYVPVLFIYSFFQARRSKDHFHYWKLYFCIPIVLLFSSYILWRLGFVLTFAKQQEVTKKTWDYSFLVNEINNAIVWESPWWMLGSLGMFLRLEWKKWLAIMAFIAIILSTHLVTQRAAWTMQKHIFVATAGMAIISGIGISNLIPHTKKELTESFMMGMITISLGTYAWYSYQEAQIYNERWPNTYAASSYLARIVHFGDKVLTETGAPMILATYEKNPPIFNTTFDDFEYHNKQGEKAYSAATEDGYFELIELESDAVSDEDTGEVGFHTLHNSIKSHMKDNYIRVYSDTNSVIYKRIF